MKNICVAIETTGNHLGLSIHSFDEKTGAEKCLASFSRETKARQSDLLIPTLSRLLKKAEVKKKDIDLVAVDVGPGSFTGVRVGVSVARTLGQALEIPVVGVSSLEILAAYDLRDNFSHEPASLARNNGYIISSIPALQGELYFAIFKIDARYSHAAPAMKTVVPPSWTSEVEFSKVVSRFKNAEMGKSETLSPKILAELAIRRFVWAKNKKKFDFSYTVPLYLQPSWAERKNGK